MFARTPVSFLLVALFPLLMVSETLAAVYVWEDESGNMHFTDYPKDARYESYLFEKKQKRTSHTWQKSKIVAEIRRLAPLHGMDPELIQKVVWAESSFDPLALSHKGAMGLMQLMPDTAKMLGVGKPFDPVQNLDGGIRYLRYLMDRFKGKVDWALAAYHAGENRVARHQGIPPIDSTQRYVKKILDAYLGQ